MRPFGFYAIACKSIFLSYRKKQWHWCFFYCRIASMRATSIASNDDRFLLLYRNEQATIIHFFHRIACASKRASDDHVVSRRASQCARCIARTNDNNFVFYVISREKRWQEYYLHVVLQEVTATSVFFIRHIAKGNDNDVITQRKSLTVWSKAKRRIVSASFSFAKLQRSSAGGSARPPTAGAANTPDTRSLFATINAATLTTVEIRAIVVVVLPTVAVATTAAPPMEHQSATVANARLSMGTALTTISLESRSPRLATKRQQQAYFGTSYHKKWWQWRLIATRDARSHHATTNTIFFIALQGRKRLAVIRLREGRQWSYFLHRIALNEWR